MFNSSMSVSGTIPGATPVRRIGKCKWAVLGAALAAALVLPLGASAQGRFGHGAWHGGSSHYRAPVVRYAPARYYGHGGHYRGGYWSGGRWVAGAVVAGAVAGLVGSIVQPAPAYYAPPPVVYAQPSVVYEGGYPATRVVQTQTRTVVYGDPYQTRYIRSEW